MREDHDTGGTKKLKGRGTASNPGNRFAEVHAEPDPEATLDDAAPRTQLIRDSARTIIASNQSPDVGFSFSVNPYRGCEHGCAYCYARPSHEYLGFSAGIDFETKILVKYEAAQLLRRELSARSWKPEVIAMSGVTDCYQPIERKLGLTRACLEVLAEFRNPVAIVTKNHLVTRDIDLLGKLAVHGAARVLVSVTTLDDELCADLEPRTSRPHARLEAIRKLSEAGISVGVNIAPLIPGLTEHEVPAILRAAREAGASFAWFVPLRLPMGVKDIFAEWLEVNRPLQKEKVLGRIRDVRGGVLNDSRFGSRMRGQGPFAEQMSQLFKLSVRKLGFPPSVPPLSTEAFRRPPQPGEQLDLFSK